MDEFQTIALLVVSHAKPGVDLLSDRPSKHPFSPYGEHARAHNYRVEAAFMLRGRTVREQLALKLLQRS